MTFISDFVKKLFYFINEEILVAMKSVALLLGVSFLKKIVIMIYIYSLCYPPASEKS